MVTIIWAAAAFACGVICGAQAAWWAVRVWIDGDIDEVIEKLEERKRKRTL